MHPFDTCASTHASALCLQLISQPSPQFKCVSVLAECMKSIKQYITDVYMFFPKKCTEDPFSAPHLEASCGRMQHALLGLQLKSAQRCFESAMLESHGAHAAGSGDLKRTHKTQQPVYLVTLCIYDCACTFWLTNGMKYDTT